MLNHDCNPSPPTRCAIPSPNICRTAPCTDHLPKGGLPGRSTLGLSFFEVFIMNNYPWFPLYTSSWLASKQICLMGPHWEGPYLRLLCHMWEDPECALPDDDDQLAKLSGTGEGWLKGGSSLVRPCFTPHPTKKGFLTNDRLMIEHKKRVQWAEKSRAGGLKSAESRRSKAKGGSKGGATVVEPSEEGWCNDLHPQLQIHNTEREETPLPPSPKTEPPPKPTLEVVEIPDNIKTNEFMVAWEDWYAHRRASKMKKWTPQTAKATLAKLSGWGPKEAIQSIRNSIENGYAGLFKPNKANSGRNHMKERTHRKEGKDYDVNTIDIDV